MAMPPRLVAGASSAKGAVAWGAFVWVNEGGTGGLRRLRCEVDHMHWGGVGMVVVETNRTRPPWRSRDLSWPYVEP